VALKSVTRGKSINEEASILRSLHHPNILQLFGLYEDENKDLFMVTEFATHGSLDKFLRENRVPTRQLIQFCHGIASGMCRLEDMNLIHRDLALRNILVIDGLKVKIGDFGLSQSVDTESSSSLALPVKWCAPEIIDGSSKYGIKSDVWSFGIVVWEIFSYGGTPYPEMSGMEAVKWILEGNRMSLPPNCPKQVVEMVNQCWVDDPQKRLSFEILQHILNKILDEWDASTSDIYLNLDRSSLYQNINTLGK